MKLSSIRPFLISPPFGTYFSNPAAYSVVGSFTPTARPGRLGQILRTVRHVNGHWVNKIGLRNPGMSTLMYRPLKPNQVISLAPINGDRDEWDQIGSFVMEYVGRHGRIHPVFEINISCPNTNHPVPAAPDTDKLKRIVSAAIPGSLIFKLQPFESSVGVAFFLADHGVEYLHLSNTLPSPVGGISGEEQRKVNMPLVDRVSNMLAGYDTEIIAGGGIYTVDHMVQYVRVGATRFSLSTAWFWPPRAKLVMAALASTHSGRVVRCRDGTQLEVQKLVIARPPIDDGLHDRPELTALIEDSVAAYKAMTPEQQREHDEAQRESWVRGNIELDRLEREERMTTKIKPRDQE